MTPLAVRDERRPGPPPWLGAADGWLADSMLLRRDRPSCRAGSTVALEGHHIRLAELRTAFLLLEFYRQSANAQVGRARGLIIYLWWEVVVRRSDVGNVREIDAALVWRR